MPDGKVLVEGMGKPMRGKRYCPHCGEELEIDEGGRRCCYGCGDEWESSHLMDDTEPSEDELKDLEGFDDAYDDEDLRHMEAEAGPLLDDEISGEEDDRLSA